MPILTNEEIKKILTELPLNRLVELLKTREEIIKVEIVTNEDASHMENNLIPKETKNAG